MDTRIMEYMISIAKHKSISRAAEELYLTQSALNQQLLKLEHELGAPLFVRTRNNWEMTEIGELYVEQAKEIIKIKNQTYNQIQDLAGRWKGTVTVGLTPERGIQLFTAIYPTLHMKYPDTVFQPVEASVETQVRMMDSGKMDIGFQTILERKYKHLTVETICYEPFYLCVPRSHPLAGQEKSAAGDYPEISLQLFRDDMFTLVKKTSTMRVLIDQLFKKAGFEPKLLFESVSMTSMRWLAESEQCCSIIPRYYAHPDSDVSYFSLGPDANWEVCAVYPKNHYITQAARDFIKMATVYWRENPYGAITF